MTTIWPFGAFLLLAAYSDICMALFAGSVNLMEGTFTCESMTISKTLDISKLCDSRQDCFLVHEKFRIKHKCTYDCPIYDGKMCTNHGACIQHKCICNKGWSGPNCSQPSPAPPKKEPCNPSPCGPWSQCRVVNGQAVCSCMHEMIGSPPTCRPECTISSECPTNRACLNRKCTDPCPSPCGVDSRCEVINHSPVCSCRDSYTGDPFVRCFEIKKAKPTTPSPCSKCGPNTQCTDGQCRCIQEYLGDPYVGCRPECVINSDCPHDKACIRSKCRDPCKDACGKNAICDADNHAARCNCPNGMTGNAHLGCSLDRELPSLDPCDPSPCGLNSQCRKIDGTFWCSCIAGYLGPPPNCRPECVRNADCPANKACINARCDDPCPGHCGQNATCQVSDHIPMCSCPDGYTGNSSSACDEIKDPTFVDPCEPSLCGLNSLCRAINGTANCSCKDGYIGPPPSCTPKCSKNSDCPPDKACKKEKCEDPCVGLCDKSARCQVVNHEPNCTCGPTFTGNPKIKCKRIQHTVVDPCKTLDCGSDGVCTRMKNNTASCSCKPGYIGAPPSCIPKCSKNSDCPPDKACKKEKCEDPCVGLCDKSARCQVVNHEPNCTCGPTFTGNPKIKCKHIQHTVVDPCKTLDCGSNGVCTRMKNNTASCSCKPGYIGAPPSCTPKCSKNSDCPPDKACKKEKCEDPCVGLCDKSARCQVVNHEPNCTCGPTFTGNPKIKCKRIQHTVVDPCKTLDCGSDGVCTRMKNNTASCSCKPGYIGAPPSCIPKCSKNSDCPPDKACKKEKCEDPCVGLCDKSARCQVVNHEPNCTCGPTFTGNPKIKCKHIQHTVVDPCKTLDCGSNGVCTRMKNNTASCSCKPGYIGAPPSCTPKCSKNSDCPPDKACKKEKCEDPCVGLCDKSALCQVVNHEPNCTCGPTFTGNPKIKCKRIQHTVVDPCKTLDCGSNGVCTRMKNNTASCSCKPGYIGAPPSCTPKCSKNSDCPPDKACKKEKCEDPCVGLCDKSALCQVVNHEPNCTCGPTFTGNPKIKCKRIQHTVVDPCKTLDCGSNGVCTRMKNNTASCSCKPGYIGAPPSCTPKCSKNSDCPPDKACKKEKCEDPCVGLCDKSALCQVVNHEPNCTCGPTFTGNPKIKCKRIQHTVVDPCKTLDCGSNGVCTRMKNNTASCSCKPGYIGAPPSCTPKCSKNSDCPPDKACKKEKCEDPCVGLCDKSALCQVVNHEPNCTCGPTFTGNPKIKCKRIQHTVVDPCKTLDCGSNGVCTRMKNNTASCSCKPGYIGAPPSCTPKCSKNSDCPPDKACKKEKCEDPCIGLCDKSARCQVVNHEPNCTCGPTFTGNPKIKCKRIPNCSNEKNEISDANGKCICQQDSVRDNQGNCVPCRKETGMTVTPDGRCVCWEEYGYKLNKEGLCKPYFLEPKKLNCARPDIIVELDVKKQGFEGQLYVEDHKDDDRCHKKLNIPSGTNSRTETFNIRAGYCDVVDESASFVLVVRQDSPSPHTTAYYLVNCTLHTFEEVKPMINSTTISMVTDSISSNKLRITREDGYNVHDSYSYKNLQLRLEFESSTKYGRFPHNCVAYIMQDRKMISPITVTDKKGCATNSTMFSEWKTNPTTGSLNAIFNPALFSVSENITFQCHILVCDGRCRLTAACQGNNISGGGSKHRTLANVTLESEYLRNFKTEDIPMPNSTARCFADKIQVGFSLQEQGFKGRLYVINYETDENCYKNLTSSFGPTIYAEITIRFGHCGVYAERQSFSLLVQNDQSPYNLQVYSVNCSANVPYSPSRPPGNGITSISHAPNAIAFINGTIKKIVSRLWYGFTVTDASGSSISTTKGNENLQLRVVFEAQSIYTGFVHDCVAKMTKGGEHSEPNVTDNRGCPTKEKYLSKWAYDVDARSLIANFKPDQFPSSDDITFHCKIRFCINSCLNDGSSCQHGYDYYDEPNIDSDIDSDIDGALLAETTITSTSLRIVERDRNDDVKENWRPVTFSNGTWLPNSVKVLCSVQDQEFKGKLYVNSAEYGADEMCYRALSGTTPKLELEISYGRCGVVREKGFNLIVRDNLQQGLLQIAKIDFKREFVRYNKTIINNTWVANEIFEILPLVPAAFVMRLTKEKGSDSDQLLIEIVASENYGVFARKCTATTMNGTKKIPVTDENGCAIASKIFGEWQNYNETHGAQVATLDPDEFPRRDTIKFQCNIRTCKDLCPSAACGKYRHLPEDLSHRQIGEEKTVTCQIGPTSANRCHLTNDVFVLDA